jgi:hypothetical protein
MRRSHFSAAATALVLSVSGVAVFTSTVSAQKTTRIHPGQAGSPHVRTDWAIDGANISVEYGRPSLKGRVPGESVEPMEGQEWRIGADEATTLKTDKPLRFGTLAVPAGTYTLYAIPVKGQWRLIVSKEVGQWGIPYPSGKDLGRVPMTMSKPAKPVEQLTISIDDTPAGGTLRIEWGTTAASVSFSVG